MEIDNSMCGWYWERGREIKKLGKKIFWINYTDTMSL